MPAIVHHAWQYAGQVEQVSGAGDYLRCEVGGESIICRSACWPCLNKLTLAHRKTYEIEANWKNMEHYSGLIRTGSVAKPASSLIRHPRAVIYRELVARFGMDAQFESKGFGEALGARRMHQPVFFRAQH